MRVARAKDSLTLIFKAAEGRVLRRIVLSISQNYLLRPGEMDAKAAAVWYSTNGCEKAKMSAEETREWLAQLHQLKCGHLRLLQAWEQQLAHPAAAQCELRLTLEEAAGLVTVLNDHRLLAAARNDIGQDEMRLHSLPALGNLRAAQQTALYEIHFLGYLIEEILRALPHNCADWQER